MWKTILGYGLFGGALIVSLRLLEYRLLVVGHALEIYGGVIAALFAALGLWLGHRVTRRPAEVVVREVPVTVHVPVEVPVEVPVPVPAGGPFVADDAARERLGITARELEILQHIAAGHSTREIADRLYVSENTVKTHTSRVLAKLDARRRTQAVQRAKDAGLLP